MIDVQHKVLKAIKDNLEDIDAFFKDKSRIEKVMGETKTIDSWDRNDKIKMYQAITEDILNDYDINEIMKTFIELEHSKLKSIDIDIFKAVAKEYYLFLKKVYDVYLLDQIYYLLRSDIDFDTYTFDKPFKTGSNYETENFEVSCMQISFNSDNEDVDIRLYNIKEYYLELIRNLLQDKKYLFKKAHLNECLRRNSVESDNYYVWQLYFALNSLPKAEIAKNKKNKKDKDARQLVLKNFK